MESDEFVACHYTGKQIKSSEAVFVGAFIPGVKARYAVSDINLHREARKAFDLWDANCNTCKHLVRTKHEKCRAGFLEGKCAKSGADLRFHPDDPLNKACYQQRD